MDVAPVGSDIRLFQTRICRDRIRLLMSRATIHGRLVTNGAKLSHHGTKSRLGGRLGCWTPAKAKPKNRLVSGAGDSRRDQMSLRQQLRRRKLRSASRRERMGSRRYRELMLCKRLFLRIKNSLGRTPLEGWKHARK